MNRRPMVLASLILFGTALLVLTLAASMRPQPVEAQPAHAESQTIQQAPLNSAAAVWSNVPITNPGLNGTLLKAVTVDSAGTVWAVGYNANSMVIISSTNSGTSWYTFTQNLGLSTELYGVAAVSPSNIFAVGDYVPNSGTPAKTLVMHYNGSSWSQVSSVDFAGYDARLLAVAATAGGDVWAAGRKVVSGGSFIYTVVERWDSATSSFISLNTSSLNFSPGNLLYGVALTGASNVWVVGDSNSYALIGHWNGTSWAVTTYSPPGATILSFRGIALDPNANARVVGFQQVSGVYQPLMARYTFNGSAISLSSAFADTQLSGANYLFGVALTTTNDVWAAGNYTLTEHYDGLSWESVPAELVGSVQQWFYGVAVDPVRDGAWAVGYYTNGGAFQPLVERYARPVTPQPPAVTTSRYVVTTTYAYTEGMLQCEARESGVVFLHFGRPALQSSDSTILYGTLLHDLNSTFLSIEEISRTVENFADGYYNCASSINQAPHVTIAVDTSNENSDVMATTIVAQTHGQKWGLMINDIYRYLKTHDYLPFVRVAGANDIEFNWSNGPTTTIAWAEGYNSVANWPYYNNGACEGCPPYPPSGGMANQWTPPAVYTVSWAIMSANPFPQIYAIDAGNAEQWRQIALLTQNSPRGRMGFAGAFTQYGACQSDPDRWTKCLQNGTYNTPQQGWTQLWRALNFDPLGRTAQYVPGLTDITWDQ